MSDNSFNLLDTLDDRLDDLTTALAPLLSQTIQDSATKLPVADKARLYVLTTYAIESLLFSYIRLLGNNPKDHPVMRELTRVRQYVAKIKTAQAAVPEPPAAMSLDKDAANRFIKAALAGNDRYDLERAEAMAREKAGAEAKLAAMGQEEKVGSRSISEDGNQGLKAKGRKRKGAGGEGEDGEQEDGKKGKKVKKSREEKEARREVRKGLLTRGEGKS